MDLDGTLHNPNHNTNISWLAFIMDMSSSSLWQSSGTASTDYA